MYMTVVNRLRREIIYGTPHEHVYRSQHNTSKRYRYKLEALRLSAAFNPTPDNDANKSGKSLQTKTGISINLIPRAFIQIIIPLMEDSASKTCCQVNVVSTQIVIRWRSTSLSYLQYGVKNKDNRNGI